MKQILFASSNPSKIARYKSELEEKEIMLLTPKDLNINIDVDETGSSAIENALIKARSYARIVNIPVMAEDSNLYFDDVPKDKEPGVFVRRINGQRLSDIEVIKYYRDFIKEYSTNGRLTCKWVFGLALINKGKESTYTWNLDDFYMVDKQSNILKPGYPLDSLSIDKKTHKYFSEMNNEERENFLRKDDSGVVEFIVENL